LQKEQNRNMLKSVTQTGREPMLRLIIEDVAELAALAAFAGTVLCWANAFAA
jgi:hypothetical protein